MYIYGFDMVNHVGFMVMLLLNEEYIMILDIERCGYMENYMQGGKDEY